ncbi:MAG: O-antigen ligase domain-containing protein [Sphingobacteriia bacterium]|nr:MAG: O-antigen ligase domain-containing protein [Sphingobacteriia bacterium]
MQKYYGLKAKQFDIGLFSALLVGMLFIAVVIAKLALTGAVLILGLCVALPIVLLTLRFPVVGMVLYLVGANLIMWVYRMGVSFPLGTLMDAFEGIFILGLLLSFKQSPQWEKFKNPISTAIFVWIAYILIEAFNPTAESRLAWLYTVRSVALIMLMFFVFLYQIKDLAQIQILIKTWMAFSLFAALYALKQEFIGFADFEEKYIHADPNLEMLLFQAGQWRKFSIFSDPVSFSYNMVITSLLCLGLLTGPLPAKKKIWLALVGLICLWAMLYSGTRSAFALVPAGGLMMLLLKLNRQMILLGIVGALLFIGLVFAPTSNPIINRFQSAFRPSEDASFNLRKMNQKKIQPYIQSHPLGGGLGATGIWGQRFSPHSYLANFPPDSGYVRVAVELGWVGLILFSTLILTILWTGIKNYFSIKDPLLRSYCLAMVLVIFALHIGNYPQEALVQFPSSVYFYLVAAIIVLLKRLYDEGMIQSSALKR